MRDILEGMTQARWDHMSRDEQERQRDNTELTHILLGLEGHRVEVRDVEGGERRRFIVGKSTGWRPIHLEVKTTRSMGGGQARKHYASVIDLGKVR